MDLKLTLIDHHRLPDENLLRNPKISVKFGYDLDNYFASAADAVNERFDYIFFDENPDATIAAVIYLLSSETRPQYKCLPRALNEQDLTRLAGANKRKVAFFNSLWAYDSNFNSADEVILINPHESGLENISASHILYATQENPDDFTRDLAGIAVVMDYTMDQAFDIVADIVAAYPDLFADLSQKIKDITLNKYNVHDSAFGEITAMFRAPSILYGVKGVDNLVKTLVENPPFTLPELVNGGDSPGIDFLRTNYEKYKTIFEQEMDYFEQEKEQRGPVISYAPHFKSQNFVREFSNRIKDHNINSIIMIRTPTGDGRTKYSIRRGELNVDLGGMLSRMGAGGGNPYAAGCTVADSEEFEKDFFSEIDRAGLPA